MFFRNFTIILILTALIAAGCTSAEAPQDQAAAEQAKPLEIKLSPEISWAGKFISLCAPQYPGGAVLVVETLDKTAPDAENQVGLFLGETGTPAAFSNVISQEALVIAVHPDNVTAALTLEQLQGIYNGEIKTWGEINPDLESLGEIIRLDYYSSSSLHKAFWEKINSDEGINKAGVKIIPSSQAMQETLAAQAGAIGYLLRRELNPKLRRMPLEMGDFISLPIRAERQTDFPESTRLFLACLQEQLQRTQP